MNHIKFNWNILFVSALSIFLAGCAQTKGKVTNESMESTNTNSRGITTEKILAGKKGKGYITNLRGGQCPRTFATLDANDREEFLECWIDWVNTHDEDGLPLKDTVKYCNVQLKNLGGSPIYCRQYVWLDGLIKDRLSGNWQASSIYPIPVCVGASNKKFKCDNGFCKDWDKSTTCPF